MDGPLLTETPAEPSPDLRPMARPSRSLARAVGIGAVVVVVVLLGALAYAMGTDADGQNPGAAAGGGNDVILAIGPAEEFDQPDGTPPGRSAELGATWETEGDLRTRQGALVAGGPARAALPLPEGDRVVQVILRRPALGWTVAFAADGTSRWAVRFGADGAQVVVAPGGGGEQVVATGSLGGRSWADLLVTWRDGRVEVALGPSVLWGSSVPEEVATDQLVLQAAEGAGGGVDLVSIRTL